MTTQGGLPSRFYDPSAFVFDTDTVIALMADAQIRKAIERGEFDNLPGSGEPLDLPDRHDPDWWLKNLAKREGLVMLPSSIQHRKDDAALDEQLDRLANEKAVRREVEQFNERVIQARYELPAGPPLITMPRDVEATLAAWAGRRTARAEDARQQAEKDRAQEQAPVEARSRNRLRRPSRAGRRRRARSPRWWPGTSH